MSRRKLDSGQGQRAKHEDERPNSETKATHGAVEKLEEAIVKVNLEAVEEGSEVKNGHQNSGKGGTANSDKSPHDRRLDTTASKVSTYKKVFQIDDDSRKECKILHGQLTKEDDSIARVVEEYAQRLGVPRGPRINVGGSRPYINVNSLRSILPGELVCEEVIKAYLRLELDNQPRFQFVPPSVVSLYGPEANNIISRSPHEYPTRYPLMVNPGVSHLIIPVKVETSHWALCIVFVQLRKRTGLIKWYNSVPSYNDATFKVIIQLRNVLRWAGLKSDSPIRDIDWTVEARRSVIQSNQSDCGVFVMANAARYIQSGRTPLVINGDKWRETVACRIRDALSLAEG